MVTRTTEAEDLVALFDASGHQDDGDVVGLGVVLEPPADPPAVQVRHHDVVAEQLRDVALVLDDENARALAGSDGNLHPRSVSGRRVTGR